MNHDVHPDFRDAGRLGGFFEVLRIGSLLFMGFAGAVIGSVFWGGFAGGGVVGAVVGAFGFGALGMDLVRLMSVPGKVISWTATRLRVRPADAGSSSFASRLAVVRGLLQTGLCGLLCYETFWMINCSVLMWSHDIGASIAQSTYRGDARGYLQADLNGRRWVGVVSQWPPLRWLLTGDVVRAGEATVELIDSVHGKAVPHDLLWDWPNRPPDPPIGQPRGPYDRADNYADHTLNSLGKAWVDLTTAQVGRLAERSLLLGLLHRGGAFDN